MRVCSPSVTRVAVYCRISRDPGGDELGVRRQEQDCRQLAEARGWEVGEVFVDDDRSAYTGKPRPGYEAMLAALEERRVDAVIAWHPDRLHRRPVELEAFIDLVERTGAKVATVQAGDYDLASATGRMTARVVGAVARHESEHKSERLRRKHRELAEAGRLSGGGTRPFGYEVDRVTVVEAEAALIRQAVDHVLAGGSVRSVCADWARRGVQTPTGRSWVPWTVREMLVAPRLGGLREYDGKLIDAVWPAIIPPAQHRRLRLLLTETGGKKRRPGRRYLLTGGVAVCGLCGANLVARPKADGRRCYVCATGPQFGGCGKIRCLAEPLETVAVGAVLERVDHGGLLAAAPADEQPADDVAELERQLGELGEMWADGEISREGWRAANERLEQRLRDAREAELAVARTDGALQPWEGQGGALRAVWAILDLDQQRAIVAAVLERVVVNPAVRGRTRFDPDRVAVDLRV